MSRACSRLYEAALERPSDARLVRRFRAFYEFNLERRRARPTSHGAVWVSFRFHGKFVEKFRTGPGLSGAEGRRRVASTRDDANLATAAVPSENSGVVTRRPKSPRCIVIKAVITHARHRGGGGGTRNEPPFHRRNDKARAQGAPPARLHDCRG